MIVVAGLKITYVSKFTLAVPHCLYCTTCPQVFDLFCSISEDGIFEARPTHLWSLCDEIVQEGIDLSVIPVGILLCGCIVIVSHLYKLELATDYEGSNCYKDMLSALMMIYACNSGHSRKGRLFNLRHRLHCAASLVLAIFVQTRVTELAHRTLL